MWSNKYIGLPYKTHGRDHSGLDCWGLVRLVYSEQFNIQLPSFSSEYLENDYDRISELFAQYREGWLATDNVCEGDVLLFKILGVESHVGIAINAHEFLHIREGYDSVIETLNNPKWSKRLVGSFKYTPLAKAHLTAVPHPLKTNRITVPVPPGTTIGELKTWVEKEYGTEVVAHNINIVLNGRVLTDQDDLVVIQDGDILEYRSVPKGGDDFFRMALVIALAVAAPYIAGYAYTAAAGTAQWVAIGSTAASAGAAAALTAGVTLIGTALIDVIAPIRQPETYDPGQSERSYVSEGSQNSVQKYGTIPFVLGRLRMTPPQAANAYGIFASPEKNYLRSLLCWGYGPLNLEEDTLRIGQNSITTYSEVTPAHATDTTDIAVWSTATNLVDTVYGGDSAQVFSNLELESGGEITTTVYKIVAIPTDSEGISSLNAIGIHSAGTGYKVGDKITAVGGAGSPATFTVTRVYSDTEYWWNSNYGMVLEVRMDSRGEYTTAPSSIVTTAGGSGNGLQLNLMYTTKTVQNGVAGSDTIPTTEQQKILTVTNSYQEFTYTDVLTIAINFPAGCRKIEKKTGKSLAAPVKFKVEYQESINGVDQGWHPLVIPQDATNPDKAYTNSNGEFTVGAGGPKKDGFTHVLQTPLLDSISSTKFGSIISVRVGRYTSSLNEDDNYNYSYQSIFQSVTSTINKTPVIDPTGTYIARSALSVLSTNQLNGRSEAISAVVQTQARIWSNNQWQYPNSVTNNPAALFLHVLTHPAGQLYIAPNTLEEAQKIDLIKLGYWYNYCQSNGYTFNSVVSQPKSVLELLRDIAAAGKASPALINGMWTVTIDEPQATIVQLFTPHNSWGFESTKAIPKYPHALRITFYDETRDWQENEIVVYANGYNETNATLFESVQFPGVTNAQHAFDLARWQLAQARIRSEIFTLNVDAEYLVCTRGDRVRVQHDVPMWGHGSGRISNITTNTTGTYIHLDNEFVFDPTKTYTIVIRNNSTTTTSNARFVQYTINSAKDSSGYTLVSSGYARQVYIAQLGLSSIATGMLYAIGELNKVSQDLVVLSVEPSQNLTAKLRLIDYGILEDTSSITWATDVNGEKTIFANYLSLSEDEFTYNANISAIPLPQREQLKGIIPKITNIVSDITAITYTTDGSPIYNINLTHTADFSSTDFILVDKVYCEVKLNGSQTADLVIAEFVKGTVTLPEVQKDGTYTIRIRYMSKDGYFSEWSTLSTHTVVGVTIAPVPVSNFTYSVNDTATVMTLNWNKNPEFNIAGYVIRDVDKYWEDDIDNTFLWKGDSTSANLSIASTDWVNKIFYIRAYNSFGLFSETSSYVVLRADPLNAVDVNSIEYNYGTGYITTSTETELRTNANNKINITWGPIVTSGTDQLPVSSYRVFIHTQAPDMLPNAVDPTYVYVDTEISSLGISLDVSWPNLTAYLVLYGIDIAGNPGTPIFTTLARQLPNPVRNLQYQITDNVVTLSWDPPLADLNVQLPVQTYLIYESTDPLAEHHTDSGVVKIGEKAGLFTTITKLFSGGYKYWVVPVDTNNQQADPDLVSVTRTEYRDVSGPPDYELAADITSNVATTGATNALTIIDGSTSSLFLPVNTTETWASHFSTVGITSIQGMINAGYVYWLTPSNSTDSVTYTETFTLPQEISSGTVTIVTDHIGLHGTYQVNPLIEKLNGTYASVTDTSGRFENIQTIKVTLEFVDTLTGNSAPDVLIQFSKLRIFVDTKIINDGGNTSVNGGTFGTDPNGTVVSLNKTIPLIKSITITPEYTTNPTIPSYILDTSTKSATITSTAGSSLVAVALSSGTFTGSVGAKVYLTITTTSAIGRPITIGTNYEVTQVIDSTHFVIDMLTPATYNVTQSATIVDQFFRVFLRNTSNQLVAVNNAGWNVKGFK